MIYLFATNNANKVKEIQPFFAGSGITIQSLGDLGLAFTPGEDGDTFQHNALQKATETLAFLQQNGHSNMAVLSDDSGLCVQDLGGLPGVDSANFMGRETPYEVRNRHLISALPPHSNRVAKFVCVIACAFPGGKTLTTTGEVHGLITPHEPKGSKGFGYDPIFYLPDFRKTMAELSVAEKNTISHRGQALAKMKALLHTATQ